MLSSFPPDFFSWLVIVLIVIGMVFSVRQIMRDFARGPRWPESPTPNDSTELDEAQEPQQQEKQ